MVNLVTHYFIPRLLCAVSRLKSMDGKGNLVTRLIYTTAIVCTSLLFGWVQVWNTGTASTASDLANGLSWWGQWDELYWLLPPVRPVTGYYHLLSHSRTTWYCFENISNCCFWCLICKVFWSYWIAHCCSSISRFVLIFRHRRQFAKIGGDLMTTARRKYLEKQPWKKLNKDERTEVCQQFVC